MKAVPATRRSRRGRLAGSGMRPVRQTCSAVTPAWLSGTPGPYRTMSDPGGGGPGGRGGGAIGGGTTGGGPPADR